MATSLYIAVILGISNTVYKIAHKIIPNEYLSTSKTFSIELVTIKGEVIRFSTAKIHPKMDVIASSNPVL